MTLKDLEQIIYIRSELNVLSKRLEKCNADEYVGDYAKDYSSGYERIITIRGYAIKDVGMSCRISNTLEKRKNELAEKLAEAEIFIASIADSKIRTLLTLRFLEGKEWKEVAKSIYKKMTADSARMSVTRFFEKN